MSVLRPLLPGSRSALARPVSAALIAVLVVASGAFLVARTELQRIESEHEARVEADMTSVATQLESSVLKRTLMADSLAAFVTSHDELETVMFERFAEELLELQPDIRALQLAPDGVITQVFPVEGNEAAIGLDLTRYGPQADVVARTRLTNQFVVGGPLELVQGGTGFIARLSVWEGPGAAGADEPAWWGLVQVVVDLDTVLAEAELTPDRFEGQYQLRGVDGLGDEGEAFLNPDLDLTGAQHVRVDLPGGWWQLSVVPPDIGGYAAVAPHIAGGGLLALVVGVLTFQLVATPAVLRRKIDEATRETRTTSQHLQTMMNAASDGILAVDQRGVVQACNPSAAALFGRPEKRLVGGHLTEVLPHALRILGHPDTTDGGYHTRTVGIANQTDDVPVAVSAAWTGDGTLATVIVRDVTEQEAAHDALQRYAAELEELNTQLTRLDQLKRDFVAMASHEMRTPITTVRGLATTLHRAWDDLDDVSRKRCVDGIERQTGRLWQVVSDLLVASDIESGAAHAPVLPTAVGEMIAEVQAAAVSDDADVQVRCDESLVVAIPAAHVQRIIRALLSNAEKYGAAPVVITAETIVSAEQDGTWLRVSVEDHGDGVPEAFEPELFQRFSQASTGEQRTARGTGLGLAVARELARTHGGELSYERADHGGARFVVEVPTRIVRSSRDTERQVG